MSESKLSVEINEIDVVKWDSGRSITDRQVDSGVLKLLKARNYLIGTKNKQITIEI